MIMAIPMTDGRMANHFVKAEQLLFIDEQGNEIARQANPARQSDCSGKETLIDLLNARGVGRVLVRNIGHRMLARLLASRFQVYQVANQVQGADGRLDIATATPLLSPEQGGSSPTYETKAQDGGCGCHHHDEDDAAEAAHGCCGGHGRQEAGDAHGEGHGQGQGGCGGHGHRSRCCGR